MFYNKFSIFGTLQNFEVNIIKVYLCIIKNLLR